jgi:hypothetical protein
MNNGWLVLMLLVLIFGALGLFVTKFSFVGLLVVVALIAVIGGRRVQAGLRAESERLG